MAHDYDAEDSTRAGLCVWCSTLKRALEAEVVAERDPELRVVSPAVRGSRLAVMWDSGR